MTLAVDIETYSDVSIRKAGVFKYVESPAFEILLISYKYDDGPIQTIDLAVLDGEGWDPDDMEDLDRLATDLQNPAILKTAYNAQFEITCLSKYFGVRLDPAQWRCTMAAASYLGLPLGLTDTARILKLPTLKDPAGPALLKYFASPCKPTKTNGGRTRNMPWHDWDKWRAFRSYNVGDVQVEYDVRKAVSFYGMPEFEAPLFALDQQINQTGIKIDRLLVEKVIRLDHEHSRRLIARAIEITGICNPNSVPQLKEWLESQTGLELPSLGKNVVTEILGGLDEGAVKEVLKIRQRLSKSSIKKYQAMLNSAGRDDRIRGLFQYYGANRTGRWAGRLVQVQNLIKNNLEDLDLARELVKTGELDDLELMYNNVPRVLSQLVRTVFVPEDGKHLIVSDFSAIEARVIAWLAGEKWRLDVFNTHGKIYEASGAAMFGIPMDSIKKGSVERDASKIAELALGYQGGPNAMLTMIIQEKYKALERGKAWTYEPTEDQRKDVVRRWRAANPNIVKLWYACNNAAIEAVETGQRCTVGRLSYHKEKGVLFCTLPSGRRLAYPRAKLVPNEMYGGYQVVYEGPHTGRVWGRIRAYGGLFVENATQAIARDLLAEKMLTLSAEGYKIVGHVHDEIIIEGSGDVGPVDKVMSAPVSWAPGLPLKGDGFKALYYKKED